MLLESIFQPNLKTTNKFVSIQNIKLTITFLSNLIKSNMNNIKCYLKCINNQHSPIELDENEKLVGRSQETMIQDVFCSRNQGIYQLIKF